MFGRGGSDITPAIISRALEAREYHKWSDVDGFMTADPAKYSEAQLLNQLDYVYVLYKAESGCQLLHPEVCSLLGDTAVKTVIRNTFGALGNRGTEILNINQTSKDKVSNRSLLPILS